MSLSQEAIIFDLEFTAWEGSQARRWSAPGEHREIIQIGALRIDAATATELDSFSRLVCPRINPILSDFIIGLTGISQQELERDGLPFEEAHGDFLAFAGDRPLFCYGWDEVVIAENVGLYDLNDRFDRLMTTNLHHFFADAGVPVQNVNCGLLIDHLGLAPPVAGRAHDALYDCRSIRTAARHFMDRGLASPFLTPKPKFGRDWPAEG